MRRSVDPGGPSLRGDIARRRGSPRSRTAAEVAAISEQSELIELFGTANARLEEVGMGELLGDLAEAVVQDKFVSTSFLWSFLDDIARNVHYLPRRGGGRSNVKARARDRGDAPQRRHRALDVLRGDSRDLSRGSCGADHTHAEQAVPRGRQQAERRDRDPRGLDSEFAREGVSCATIESGRAREGARG